MPISLLRRAQESAAESDPHSIGYEQRGEITLMCGTGPGLATAEKAFASLYSAGTR
ncbi:MAG: hypothetical protein JOZ16_09690 [Methylobacteriaceae bacterium]|nr:hypothetical protein [Methylobacteriaceae bacterium]